MLHHICAVCIKVILTVTTAQVELLHTFVSVQSGVHPAANGSSRFLFAIKWFDWVLVVCQ
jgi:hypothetical protein